MKKVAKNAIIGEENRSQLQAVRFHAGQDSFASLKTLPADRYDEVLSYKKLRQRRKKIAIVRMLIWLICIMLVPFMVFLATVIISPNTGNNFFGYIMYVVRTDSMVPDINVNDCILVKKVSDPNDIKVGTDITFVRQFDGQTVTHRVIKVVEQDGQLTYITQGINNPSPDNGFVYFDDIVGVRVKTVGWLGQTIMFFRTPYGIILFLAIIVIIGVGFYLSFRISDDIRAVGK